MLANTTRQRDGLNSKNKIQKGGLSGRPLFQRNLQLVKYAYQQTRGNFLIIGTGGIFSSVIKIVTLDHQRHHHD
ncbi:hypothetical protein ACWEH1_31550 [Micromonospora chersina]